MKESERLSRQWFEEGWGQGRAEVFTELAPDRVEARLMSGPIDQLEQFLAFRRELLQAFPDLQVTVEDLLADDDRSAVLWRMRGTHSGPGFGLEPTGTAVDVKGTTWQTVSGGKIVSGLDCVDFGGLLDSLRSAAPR